ncbi:MAG: hypothetical protein H7335_23290, partial [Massilia sp.]|nr:hypothetical protein [Massilia sp.]
AEILPGLYAVEVNYLITHEWAVSAADILWRRSKLGLHLPAGCAATLVAWFPDRPAHTALRSADRTDGSDLAHGSGDNPEPQLHRI